MAGKWIAKAIRHPGALRATAKRKGLIHGEETLSSSDLASLRKSGSTTTKRRVALAQTLKRMHK
jgi:hypothetical protein